MSLKITDYVKIEEVKNLVLSKLRMLGLKKQVSVMNDNDLKKLMRLMSTLYLVMEDETRPDGDKSKAMVDYILYLWVTILVDYGGEIGGIAFLDGDDDDQKD